MLISIHSSVVDKGDENTWDQDTVLALENLATARREGKHIVMANRKTLKKIAQCSRLSEFSRNIYHKLYHDSTQLYSYLSAVTKYIEIVNPCYEPEVLSDSDKEIIKVPPRFFNDSELVQKTILLGENLDDAVFYETIAKVCVRWKDMTVPIVCEPRGGGGDTTSREYINIQQANKRFCLCIVDSDKIAPNGNLGSTASRLRNSDDPTCIKTQIFILDCRESENLIPNSILSKLYPGKQEKLEALNIIKSISLEVRCFLDIKEGTYLNKIMGEKKSETQNFWSNQIPQILNISDRINNSCQANWQCSSNSGKCQCQISLGLGDKTLSKTVEYLKDNSLNEIAIIVDRSMRSDWEKIGEVVINWCIAESPIRA